MAVGVISATSGRGGIADMLLPVAVLGAVTVGSCGEDGVMPVGAAAFVISTPFLFLLRSRFLLLLPFSSHSPLTFPFFFAISSYCCCLTTGAASVASQKKKKRWRS